MLCTVAGVRVVAVAVNVSFLLPFNTLTGVLTIRGTHLGVGPSFGARRWDFYDIVALPMILTGLKLGLGVGLILVVAADFVAADHGLGYLIWHSRQTLHVGATDDGRM